VLRRAEIDLVLSYTPKGNLYSGIASIARRGPFIPNVSGLGRVFTRSSILTRAVRALYRLAFRRAVKVYFQNEEDLREFVELGVVRAASTERLPGSGVDLKKFAPFPANGRRSDFPTFLLVSRMLWQKGIGEYVAAARRVRYAYPDARFQLLGAVSKDDASAVPMRKIDEWVKEGLITYLGVTDDVRPHLASADCAVLPSYYREGVPRAILEAAAMGRPVITTDAVGCRDAISDGITGFLCRPKDSADLTERMLAFIALPIEERRLMGERARAFIEEKFDERLVLEKYLQVVNEVAESVLRQNSERLMSAGKPVAKET
jgi:glycosyltransferase involved in cell wall biosynthesis